MSKPSKSILEPHAGKLAEMAKAKVTQREMAKRLEREGVKVTPVTIGNFLREKRRLENGEKLREETLNGVSSGKETIREAEKPYDFEKGPPPSMEKLIKLQRKLVMEISTSAKGDPGLVKLVAAAFAPVMEYEALQIKRAELALHRRRVAVLEQRAGAEDAAEMEQTLSPEEQRRRLKEILK